MVVSLFGDLAHFIETNTDHTSSVQYLYALDTGWWMETCQGTG